MLTQHTKTQTLLQEDRCPVPVAKFHQLRKRTKVTMIHVQRFGHYEFPCDLLLRWILKKSDLKKHYTMKKESGFADLFVQFELFLKQLFQVFHVIVSEVLDLTARRNEPFLDRKTHPLVTRRVGGKEREREREILSGSRYSS